MSGGATWGRRKAVVLWARQAEEEASRELKRRFLAVQVVAAAFLAAGLATPVASAQGTAGPPTIPLLVTGDTGSFSNLDISKDTEVDDIYGAMEALVRFAPRQGELGRVLVNPQLDDLRLPLAAGVRFWDGDEMTSADVVNALDYYRRPGSVSSADYRSVKSVTAGPYTVIVTFPPQRRLSDWALGVDQSSKRSSRRSTGRRWANPGSLPWGAARSKSTVGTRQGYRAICQPVLVGRESAGRARFG